MPALGNHFADTANIFSQAECDSIKQKQGLRSDFTREFTGSKRPRGTQAQRSKRLFSELQQIELRFNFKKFLAQGCQAVYNLGSNIGLFTVARTLKVLLCAGNC